MGTRSIVVIKDEDNKKIIEMYRQYNGYPACAGAEYKDFIERFTLVNGLSINENREVANGIGCFAAQFISHFKDGPGGYYLHAPTTDYVTKNKYWDIYNADYYYEITQVENKLHIRCWDCYENKEISL